MYKNNNNFNNDIQYLPMFMCFGLSFGIFFGMMTGNQALGMSIGMCLGVCIGTVLDAQKKKRVPLKAIVFDFDYTLGDSTEAIVESMNYALRQLGYQERSVEEIRKTIGLTIEEALDIFEGNKEAEEHKRFVGYFVERINQIVAEHSELYEDTKNVLRALKEKGYKTAIVTTKYDNQTEQILEKYHAKELIDMVVGSNNVKIPKPDPEGLLNVLKEMNLGNKEILYVGDSFVDAKTAENANVRFAAVLTGTTTREEHQKYKNEFIANNLEEIYGYILSLEED